jgi:hypothetical protein
MLRTRSQQNTIRTKVPTIDHSTNHTVMRRVVRLTHTVQLLSLWYVGTYHFGILVRTSLVR